MAFQFPTWLQLNLPELPDNGDTLPSKPWNEPPDVYESLGYWPTQGMLDEEVETGITDLHFPYCQSDSSGEEFLQSEDSTPEMDWSPDYRG